MPNAMHYQLFQYPLPGPPDLADLNAWLASHRIVSVNQHVVAAPGGALLVFVVQSVDAGSIRPGTASGPARKIDYKEELNAEDFALFSLLREDRKKIAEAEGVPVYAILTNEQLAEMAKRRPASLSALSTIEGAGKARLEKYGPRLLAVLTTPPEPTPLSPP